MRIRERLVRLERLPPWRPIMNAMGEWEPPPGCPGPLWRAIEHYCDMRPDLDPNHPATEARLRAAIRKLCDLPADSTVVEIELAMEALMGHA